MLRRVHVPTLRTGQIELDMASARHLRDVLRLTAGMEVEVFDDAGAVASATITRCDEAVIVNIDAISAPADANAREITIAAAVPKGERADWMIEKLSELGCARFIPLATARSIVLPEGRNKKERWMRIATESARQSRRRGVMRIDELTRLEDLLRRDAQATFYLSTASDAPSILEHLQSDRLMLLVGPEGGWTAEEIVAFAQHQITGVRLTETILRVETAAVAAAAIASVSSIRRPQI
jgi:16S rRNA (uracil1498-N3)-methyltransferase